MCCMELISYVGARKSIACDMQYWVVGRSTTQWKFADDFCGVNGKELGWSNVKTGYGQA